MEHSTLSKLMCIHTETLLDLRRQLAHTNGQLLAARGQRTSLTFRMEKLAREAERLGRHIRALEREHELEREACSG